VRALLTEVSIFGALLVLRHAQSSSELDSPEASNVFVFVPVLLPV